MTLSWNEIKSRAQTFIKEWEHGHREEADAKEFLIDFLNIFGVSRKKVATFEHKVAKLSSPVGLPLGHKYAINFVAKTI